MSDRDEEKRAELRDLPDYSIRLNDAPSICESPPNWEKTRDFNMRVIERDFMNGGDIREALDWAIKTGIMMGDSIYVEWAVLLKMGCQDLIDTGKLTAGAKPQRKPLSVDEVKALRDHYR